MASESISTESVNNPNALWISTDALETLL